MGKQKYMTGEELKRGLKFIRNDAIISINGDPNIKIVDMESYETLAGHTVNLNIPFLKRDLWVKWQDVRNFYEHTLDEMSRAGIEVSIDIKTYVITLKGRYVKFEKKSSTLAETIAWWEGFKLGFNSYQEYQYRGIKEIK